MSEIVNDNIGEAGTTTSGAAMDSKFSDARDASLTLDGKNVRSEGIDRRQLKAYSYPNGRLEPVVYMDQVSNNDVAAVAYAGNDGRVPFELSAGTDDLLLDWSGFGGVVMQQGDLLRINYSLTLFSHNLGTTADRYISNIDNTSGVTTGVFNAAGLCALFYPVWDTDTTTGWAPLPGRALNLNSTFVSATASIDINNGESIGCLVLSLEGIIQSGITRCNRTGTVSAYYTHTSSSPLTINKIRLNGRAPIAINSNSGSNQDFRMMNWTSFKYDPGAPFAANFTFDMERGTLGAVVMRGESL